MYEYRIVCTEQTNCSQNGHIVGVGTGTESGAANKQWTVTEVWNAIDRGHTFYTYGGGKRAGVRKYTCPCGRGSLRSTADATTANNLDNLRLCSWKAA